jgi:membrane protease YdiL (CAAX protease family)
MFLEQGIKKENFFGKYLLGSFIVFIASQLGSLPFVVGLAIKAFLSNEAIPTTNQGAMNFLDKNLSLFLILSMFVFALGTLFLVIVKYHKQSILSVTTSRKKIDWNRILFSFSLWGIFTILSVFLSFYFLPEDMVWNFKPLPFLILCIISFVMLPIQTSTEEYIFRGYLMQGFANLSKNRWFPLLMTSVIFGTMHIFNPEIEKMGYLLLIYYIGTGLFLGIITLMDEGMELALGFHAANNIFGAILVTSEWSVFQTSALFKEVSEPKVGFDTVYLPVFVLFPILIFIFSKKYRWSDWKQKLTGTIVPNNLIKTTNHD